MQHKRLLFFGVVTLILAVLAIMVIVGIVEGGDADQGDTGDDPYVVPVGSTFLP
jgi:hypothetical protein